MIRHAEHLAFGAHHPRGGWAEPQKQAWAALFVVDPNGFPSKYELPSSARKFGGRPEDYQAIHGWFDESKSYIADHRHRALRHHPEGIFMAKKIFGQVMVNSEGREVPVRYIGE